MGTPIRKVYRQLPISSLDKECEAGLPFLMKD
jgi:hypothetical protein